jgi:multidrug efflux pump subunit AcrB
MTLSMWFGPWLWRSTRFLAFALACGFALGCYAYLRAPRSIFPAISLARVEIFADAGDLAPEQVRSAVADPLEAALANVPEVRATRSYSDQGKLEVELDFDPKSDVRRDLDNVRATVAEVRDRLPLTNVAVLVEGPEMEPVISYAIASATTAQSTLLGDVESAVPSIFTGTHGLGRVTVFGGPRDAYEVQLDARKLVAAGLSARDVANAIASANVPRTAGSIVRGQERLLVVPGERPRDFGSLAAVAIGTKRGAMRLDSLGSVRVRAEPTGEQASFDGTHAVVLNAYPTTTSDAVALVADVAARLPQLTRALPPGTRITPYWDQTRLIRASQDGLRDEIFAGALIALAIIYLFLRDRALTLVAALVLPIALALTVLVLVSGGLTLNLMTLGGLAIAIGLIIDEAIVVIEAVARETAEHPERLARDNVASAVRRIARPLLAATAANVVVFIPLAYLSGIPGFFFRALSITLAVALLVSIALSLVVAPALALALGAHGARTASLGLERRYVRVLRWTLRHPLVIYAAAAGIVVLTAWLLVTRPTDFLPNVDEGQFEIKFALPAGMSADASDALATQLERVVLADASVAHEGRLLGVDTNGYLATAPDSGTIRVVLKPHADSFERVAARLRLAIANVNSYIYVEIHQLLEDQIDDLSGAPEPVQITVRGRSQRVLTKIAYHIADDIDDVRGIVDAFDGVIWQARTVRALPLPGAPADPQAFADDLRARVAGIVATEIDTGVRPLPVVVRIAGASPLERHAVLGQPEFASEVQEENGERIDRVTAGIENASLSTVIARVTQHLTYQLAHVPRGYSIEIGGTIAQQRAAFAEFGAILGVAVVLVFGVLLLTFNSFRPPLVVLAAVALAPLGVGLALVATRTALNVSSFMGMLLLVGIVVRNGILIVDAANRRRAEGRSPAEALEGAALERLRPILMTTFAALGALAPLALGLGAGSELARPLAVAVIGGLGTATAFTLILIPVLYAQTAAKRKCNQT